MIVDGGKEAGNDKPPFYFAVEKKMIESLNSITAQIERVSFDNERKPVRSKFSSKFQARNPLLMTIARQKQKPQNTRGFCSARRLRACLMQQLERVNKSNWRVFNCGHKTSR